MNGVHDMGGMEGFGPIQYEKNEPVFHTRWEGHTFALNRAMRAWGKWNIDTGRYQIELIPAADYLGMSYYERWFTRLVELLVKHGFVTREEIARGEATTGFIKAKPALTAEMASRPPSRDIASSHDPTVVARFKVDQRVRARNIHPTGHTRLPRYARGKVGEIVRDHGVFDFPDTNAHFLGENRQHVYSVRFASRELWGERASPCDSVYIDMWDDYLEQA
jgi:nitrile hydratase subunit beta